MSVPITLVGGGHDVPCARDCFVPFLPGIAAAMTNPIRFCLVLHNHQPIGNFDGVFEQAYQDSYLPFLDVFEPYGDLRLSLHTSGPLLEWLDDHHPDYVDRLARLVAAGRIEIVGGAYYEPILTMIPSRDRIGQIERLHASGSSRVWRPACRGCGFPNGCGNSR